MHLLFDLLTLQLSKLSYFILTMMERTVVNCVLIVYFLAATAALPPVSEKEEVHIRETKIQILRELLYNCTKVSLPAEKKTSDLAQLDKRYNALKKHYIRCKTPPTTTSTTILPPTTTLSPALQNCRDATNFSQPWRKDGNNHLPKDYNYNGYACDMTSALKWFRFTGAAGTQMLNRCPTTSCGTFFPYWTEDRMPTTVGVETTISAYTRNVYEVCRKQHRVDVKVIRCSSAADYIYRYSGPIRDSCFHAFCGM
ncbi:oncoprotein-induced transcript 3 protein-like [Watersipora subatra]|uniref:oncoprotein-induced transcript 3 protein-like n=1 Tax=Watersipora subatra TaxID=2589382 RepID=UPI00355B4621